MSAATGVVSLTSYKKSPAATARGVELALQVGRVATWELEVDTGRVTRSATARELFGLPAHGTRGDFEQIIHPLDVPRYRTAVRQGLNDGAFDVELRLLVGGSTVWVRNKAELHETAPGRRVLIGVTLDITQQKQVENALREDRERFGQYANVSLDWFWETDADLRLTRMDGAVSLLPTSFSLMKKRWEAYGADPTAEPWASHIRVLFARRSFQDFEFEMASPSGKTVWVSSSGQPFYGLDGSFQGYRGVARNVTDRKEGEAERKRLSEQLHQAQKLQTLGQLTGGIAHDFNNLLTVVLGNAEIIAEESTDPHLKKLAQEIEATAEHGSELNRKLLAFGRRQSLKPKAVCLSDVIRTSTGILRRTLGEHIELRTGESTESLALVDQAQLESAILNLAVNARDAMPDGGQLTIEAEEIRSPDGSPEFVSLTVSDTGTGMPPEVLERVFEPFFTTKDVGNGSGLGLSMVYGFVEQSGGHVSIRSAVGAGTSVTILLPVAAQAGRDKGEAQATSARRGKGKILVVEDDANVRRYVTSTLLALGYDLVEAPDAPAALEVLREDPCIDLLLTDIVLPKGMNGLELARQAQALNPTVRLLLTSGYPEAAFQQHGRLAEDAPLLRKPYKRAALAEAVSQVLGGEGGTARKG